jgi:Ca2+-binding EF-hand superfamily protein
MWEDLRKEFVEMDPYGTGFVSREEFKDVLTELCVHLSEFEINKLSDKFDIKRDARYGFNIFMGGKNFNSIYIPPKSLFLKCHYMSIAVFRISNF